MARRQHTPLIEFGDRRVIVDATPYDVIFLPVDQREIEGMTNAVRVAVLRNSHRQLMAEVLGYRAQGTFKLSPVGGKLAKLWTSEWDKIAAWVGSNAPQ